ncbi:hypothetical protein, partial [Corynebacterium glyciniphilum]|uniref:hypothetical protein n=1 Tax=Corynebacterium glyciniphilum TaxID=1404244 RepID=UPI0026554B0A
RQKNTWFVTLLSSQTTHAHNNTHQKNKEEATAADSQGTPPDYRKATRRLTTDHGQPRRRNHQNIIPASR